MVVSPAGEDQGDGGAVLVLANRELPVRSGISIVYALVKLGIDVQVVRPLRDGQLVDLETVLEEGDRIVLLPLVAGGA